MRDPYDICSTPELLAEEERIRYIFETNVKRAVESDIIIAYIPSASMGTAVEIHEASKAGKIVYTISPLSSNWVIRLYSTEVFSSINDFQQFFIKQHTCMVPSVQQVSSS